MRDADRGRERITIQLEPRQVTWLVVLGLVALGGLFGGGYLLGRQHGGESVPLGPALSGLAAIDAVSSPASAAPESAEDSKTPAALGEVEFMFPSALGSRPGREEKRPSTVRIAADRVGAEGIAPPELDDRDERDAPADRPERDAPDPERARPRKKPVKLAPVRIADERPRQEAPRDALPPAEMRRLTVMPARPALAAPALPASALPAPAVARVEEAAPTRQRRYTVQLRAAPEQSQADELADELRRKGYSPRVVLAQVPGKGTLYRVRVGEFGSRAEARQFQRVFRNKTGHADAGFITEL